MATADISQFPAFFPPLLESQYDADDVARILEGSTQRRTTSLRANALVSNRDEVAQALNDAGIVWKPVPWYADAFEIVDAREADIWHLPVFEQGKCYLQSLSSMIPALFVEPAAGLDVLDMCAAPGGKTTQMAALGGAGCHITACEMHAPRAEKLGFNLAKLGASNVTVLREDARRLSEFFRFDRILLDAPCSGSGTLRAGNPKMFKTFTPKLVDKCAASQKALLARALMLLKPGATLVYATCSVLERENEAQVKAALKAASKNGSYELVPLAAPDADVPTLPTSLEGALCVCPTQRYEGFFVAKIKRTA